MGHQIFDTILFRKIESFVSTFVEDSKSIFYNGTQLIHPGEFGRYRENSLKNLLQLITHYKVSDGFIITSNNTTSSQCDIVIYDNFDFPVLENNLTQFFSIESVISIGEVKSTLTKTAFTTALRKLAQNKMMSKDIKGAPIKKNRGNEYDHPISFLVCKNLDFNITKINFEEIYKEIPREYWHNLILAVDQGLFDYNFDFENFDTVIKINLSNANINPSFMARVEVPKLTIAHLEFECDPTFFELINDDKFNHIKMFITSMSQAISRKTIFKTEMLYYTGFNSDDFDLT